MFRFSSSKWLKSRMWLGLFPWSRHSNTNVPPPKSAKLQTRFDPPRRSAELDPDKIQLYVLQKYKGSWLTTNSPLP